MSQRYFTCVDPSERKDNGGGRMQSQTQKFSPKKTPRSINFPRSSSEDNFVDFVPLDNSSPVQVGGRGGHWRMHNNLGHNSSFSPYSSNRNQKFASHNRSFSYNKSQRYSPQNNRGGHHNYRGSNNDLRSWYDPSMVEDPWAALEKKQEQRQQNTDGVNNVNTPGLGNNMSPQENSSNKNSNSASSLYRSVLDDSWTQSAKSKELHLDTGDSPRSTDLTDIKELSPSLSEKGVGLHNPRYVSPI